MKGKRSEHRILMQGNELRNIDFYSVPNIVEAIRFNPERKPDPGQWCYIEMDDVHKDSMLGRYVAAEASTGDLNPATKNDYQDIDAVFRIFSADGRIIFTKITNSYKVENKIFLRFYDEQRAKVVTQEHEIAFSGKPDAYYDGSVRLYFKDYPTIRELFPGIEDYFRQATQDEVDRFFASDLLDVDESVKSAKIGQRHSHRIASILDDENIDMISNQGKVKILSYAENYPESQVRYSETGKLLIAEKKDLGRVLDLLGSKYYTSEVTGKKMAAFAGSEIVEEV